MSTTITIYTVPEVAELLKCSDNLVRKLIKSGRLEATNLADSSTKRHNYRVTAQAVREYLEGSTVPIRNPIKPNRGCVGRSFMKLG